MARRSTARCIREVYQVQLAWLACSLMTHALRCTVKIMRRFSSNLPREVLASFCAVWMTIAVGVASASSCYALQAVLSSAKVPAAQDVPADPRALYLALNE